MGSRQERAGLGVHGGPQVWSAVVLLAEALGTVVAALMGVKAIAAGETHDVSRSVVEIIIFLLCGAAFVVLARALGRGLRWPRTPTVMWHAILIPVAVSLWQAGEVAVAALLTLGITAAILGVLLSRPTVDR